jgi:glucosamine--fructose-6-phosphate aminotransferase (isomerizing)
VAADVNIMEQEIFQQPEVCARLFERESRGLQAFAFNLKKNPPAGILMAARGSSDHAAIYARYLLEYLTGIPVALAAPSLLTVFGRRSLVSKYLVIGVSQSGQGPDICAVVRDASRQGARTLSFTNDPGSPLAKASHHVVDLGAEKEQAVAATKTYTAELAGLALLAAQWAGKGPVLKQLQNLPAVMARVLDDSQKPVKQVAGGLKKLSSCVVLGRGFQLGNTHEIALKMKECASVPALSYSTADFQHGPIALLEGGFPVFLVSAPGRNQGEGSAYVEDLISRGGRVFKLGLASGAVKKQKGLSVDMEVKASAPDYFSPLLTILPGQWLAYYLGLVKGKDPSKPIGLKKVTKTK